MPNADDKLDADAEKGQKDINAQARRFNRVGDILQRAINRYDQILADLGGAPPSADPTVQAALQRIVQLAGRAGVAGTSVDGILVKVAANPGPIQDPASTAAVQPTVQALVAAVNDIATAVLANPGPIQDPAVQSTLQRVVTAGTGMANGASAALGLPAPCVVGGGGGGGLPGGG